MGWPRPLVLVIILVAGASSACGNDSAGGESPTAARLVGGGATVRVSTSAELSTALGEVAPGQTIKLADGVYHGNFELARPGTRSEPIRIIGSRRAVLDSGTLSQGYVLHLDGANHVRVVGITVRNGQKAVVLDQSHHVELRRMNMHTTGAEVVLLRNYSRDNVVRNNLIHDAGLVSPGYGEGVYVGQSKGNWSSPRSRTGGGPDTSDRNVVIGNRIFDTAAECIDLKEGTTGGRIVDNSMDGTGLTGANYADSWVDVAGNDYSVIENTGTNSGTTLLDGYQTRVMIKGWGRGNVFRRNASAVNGDGYAIRVLSPRNSVYASNTQTGAREGLTNIAVTGSR